MARNCMECESRKGMVQFKNETFTVEHEGAKTKVSGLSGWRCGDCGEVEFDARSAKRYASAGDGLVLRARRQQGQELRRIRRKLRLTQAEAARITGGGHNAFSRYESGEVVPMSSVVNLFVLLDKHPELLKDIRPIAEPNKRRPSRARSMGLERSA